MIGEPTNFVHTAHVGSGDIFSGMNSVSTTNVQWGWESKINSSSRIGHLNQESHSCCNIFILISVCASFFFWRRKVKNVCVFESVTNTVLGLPSNCHQRSPFRHIDSHTTHTVTRHPGLHFPCSIVLIALACSQSLTHTILHPLRSFSEVL